MKSPVWLNQVNQLVTKRSLIALEKAASGAKQIKMIEEQYFAGKKISPDSEKGKSVYDYFKSLLERELWQIRFNLSQFRLINFYNPINKLDESSAQENEILKTLSFIESVIGKYRNNPENIVISQPFIAPPQTLPTNPTEPIFPNNSSVPSAIFPPRSSPFFEVSQKLSPKYEQQVIQQLRTLRQERQIGIRFLILLVVVPLFVQIISRNFIYSPLINWKFVDTVKIENIEITEELAERFLEEFSKFKEGIEIKTLLGITPELSKEKKQELLQKKAIELEKEVAYATFNGWKNLLADLTSLVAFTVMISWFRRQFVILRSFIGRYFLGLSDVTKVFLFILLTDMFVGFHSAEGWEIILGSIFEHFGLPENRSFIYLFIATVPVILDSTFKLLIFNFFTRKSPTAVALLEKMQQ